MTMLYGSLTDEKKKARSSAPVRAKPPKNYGNGNARSSLEKPLSMPGSLQSKMERAFNADFSKVSLYESPSVSRHGFDAQAQGNRIGFAPGRFNPSTFSGQALLGHELSHSVSHAQGETSFNGGSLLKSPSLESHADSAGIAAAQGRSFGGASKVSVSSGSSSAAPVQGGTQRGILSKVFGTVNRATKEKMVDSLPHIRAAVAERDMHNIFVLEKDTVIKAEQAVKGITPPTNPPPTNPPPANNGMTDGAEGATDALNEHVDTASTGVGLFTGGGDFLGKTLDAAKKGGSDVIGGFGGVLSSGMGGIVVAKDVIDVFANPGAESVYNLLYDSASATNSVLSTVNTFGEAAGKAWAAEGSQLSKAIPGLSIALATVDMCKSFYSLGKSSAAVDKARKKINEMESAASDQGFSYKKPEKSLETIQKDQTQKRADAETAHKKHDDAQKLFESLCEGTPAGSVSFENKFEAAVSMISANRARETAGKTQAAVNKDEYAKEKMRKFSDDHSFMDKVKGLGKSAPDQWRAVAGSKAGYWSDKENTHSKSVPLMQANYDAQKTLTQAETREAAAFKENGENKVMLKPFEELASLIGLKEDIIQMNAKGSYETFKKGVEELKAKADKADEEYRKSVDAYHGFNKVWNRTRGAKIARRVAAIGVSEACFDITSDMLAIAGGICDLTGVASWVGATLAGISALVSVAKVISTASQKYALKRKNIKGELQAKAVNQQQAMQAAGLSADITDTAVTKQGRFAAQRDKLTNIDNIIQDIIDQVYSKMDPNQTKLHGTSGTGGLRGKRKHGSQTTKLYKHLILFEMGVPSGYRADISNNISVNRAANLLIAARQELGTANNIQGVAANASTDTVTYLKSMGLYKEKKKLFSRNTSPVGEFMSLKDTAKAFGNMQDAYQTLVMPPNQSAHSKIAQWERELGISANNKDSVTKAAEQRKAEQDRLAGSDTEEGKRYRARQFGTQMMKGTADSKKSLFDVTALPQPKKQP